MTKLPSISGREAIKALRKAGFVVVRQKGSHVRLKKTTKEGPIKLTIPMHPTLKKGTLSRIIKDAGLTVEEFAELL
ncbi:MAG: type II toxin-antitoxin system HicA family toxin [Thermoplasmata archaeon]|nr:type II toxin-antitoxin system HicA family toxin [Thermoplasmata archaeon]